MKPLKQLLLAVQEEELPTIKEILEAHPDFFSFEFPFGWPISTAAWQARPRCDVLTWTWSGVLSNGGDVNQRTYNGVSLLFLANVNRFSQDMGVPDYLSSQGANMSALEKAVVAVNRPDTRTLAGLLDSQPELVRATGHEGLHCCTMRLKQAMAIWFCCFWSGVLSPMQPLTSALRH